MKGSSLFITGANGFIGKSFLQKVEGSKYNKIFCLIRNPHFFDTPKSNPVNLEIVEGDLLNAKTYQASLKQSDIVVHFAALTGKQKPHNYFEVNTEGTETLVEKCQRAGVRKFLYVSTIAAKFPDKHLYYYAQSKLKAEEIVKNSGLSYVIVRPTQVIGDGGAWWENISKLAIAPITIIFGDGKVQIQPIYLDDLTDCIVSIIEEEKFDNEIFEVGGPEQLTLEDFVSRIRRFRNNRMPRLIHVPLEVIIPVLSFLEKFFYNFMPVNAGQLASFKNDGTVSKDRIFPNSVPRMKNIDEMITLLTNSG